MKNTIIKNIVALAALILMPCFASAQQYVIHMTNGEDMILQYNDVEYIMFQKGGAPLPGNHECVDLGLSVKWATCNVGANIPEEYGDFFAWGEISPKNSYTEDNSKTYNKPMGDIAGNPDYDAATANWGTGWRLPTYSEMQELVDECTWKWEVVNNVNGYRVTGPNGNSIFLPANGNFDNWDINDREESGYYWTSTPYEGYNRYSFDLDFDCGYYHTYWYHRNIGHAVRPVTDGTSQLVPTATTGDVIEVDKTSAKVSVSFKHVPAGALCGVQYLESSASLEDAATVQCYSETTKVKLENLKAGTDYKYRAYINVNGEFTYGGFMEFTTESDEVAPSLEQCVDLGLSVKWASYNVGATKPEECGDFFAWGEISTKDDYTESNCDTYGKQFFEIAGDPEYDAATAIWGSEWRMPTYNEVKELMDECTWTWTEYNGVKGQLVTGPNGNSIFLPVTGYRHGTERYSMSSGYYWSATPYEEFNHACHLDFDKNDIAAKWEVRGYGNVIRPVSNK